MYSQLRAELAADSGLSKMQLILQAETIVAIIVALLLQALLSVRLSPTRVAHGARHFMCLLVLQD